MGDDQLKSAFEDLSLPFTNWTHHTHVRIAYIYARDFGFQKALQSLRSGIQAYNRRNQVPETPTSGYNETITVAYLRLVCSAMEAYGQIFPTSDSETFCKTHPHLLNKSIVRVFYSPARRTDPASKFQFLEPDLCSLPEPGCDP